MITRPKNLRTGRPLWHTKHVPAETLTRDQATDILIIGAGITGAMAAESLTATGFRVILIDRRDAPLLGSTAATTALLQYEIDVPLSHLVRKIGFANAARAWRRSKLALESLGARMESLNIHCDCQRRHSLYLAGDVLNAKALRNEWELRNQIGLATDYLTRDELHAQYGIRRPAALRGYGSYTAHPVNMAAGFLNAAMARGATIYCPVTATDIKESRHGVTIRTDAGPTITAKKVIYATGYEIPKPLAGAKYKIISTYAIATHPQPDAVWPEEAVIWEASDPYLYLRTTPDGRVICGGEDEDFEDEYTRDALIPKKTKRLEKKVKALFPNLNPRAEFHWAGAFGSTPTGLPGIGRLPRMRHSYAILAFGGNGITFSRLAAELLTGELTNRPDPDADLFAF